MTEVETPHYIYAIILSKTGHRKHLEPCYVGVSTNIAKRWQSHQRAAASGSSYAIHRALRKYGKDAFQIVEIDRYVSAKKAYAAEIQLIALLETHTTKGGFNNALGGRGRTPEEASAIMRAFWSDPEKRRARISRMASANVRTAKSKEWRDRVAQAVAVRANDDAWRRNVANELKRRNSDASWRQRQAAGSRQFKASPEGRKLAKRVGRRNAANLQWQQTTKTARERLQSTPEWKVRVKLGQARRWVAYFEVKDPNKSAAFAAKVAEYERELAEIL